MDFAVSIIELVKSLKEKRESINSNQIGRSGTSIRVMLISSINTSSKADFQPCFFRCLQAHAQRQENIKV